MKPLSSSLRESLELATAQYEATVGLAEEYLDSRGIEPATAEAFRLGVVSRPIPGHEYLEGRLSIPSIGPHGNVYSLRFRALGESDAKYLGLPGQETRLFNVRAVAQAHTPFIAIAEGEFDAIVLNQAGIPAVAVTGSNSWKDHHPRLFAGFEDVFVFGDNDKAGVDFARTVADTLPNSTIIQIPDVNDVNDLYLAEGDDLLWELIQRDRSDWT